MRSCRVLRYFNNLDFSRKGRTNFTQLAGSFFVTVVKFLLFPDTCMRLKISTGNWEVRWAPSADREEAETIPGEVCCHSEKENPPSPLVWTRNLQRLKRQLMLIICSWIVHVALGNNCTCLELSRNVILCLPFSGLPLWYRF